MEKVAFIKQFPGLLANWEAMEGKAIEAVIPLIHLDQRGEQGDAGLLSNDLHSGR